VRGDFDESLQIAMLLALQEKFASGLGLSLSLVNVLRKVYASLHDVIVLCKAHATLQTFCEREL